MSIYTEIERAYKESGLIEVDSALQRFSCSVGCHLLNLVNNEHKLFYSKSKLTNFRTHIVFQAPSGFSKSMMLDFFLHPETGLLSEAFFPTDVESTFTTEAWMGTMTEIHDEEEETYVSTGVFQRFKKGIVGADEYARLKDMAENPGDRNDVVYLLKALDDGRSSKNMAYGRIDINDICMTFWCGMRPTSLRFTSGLGRRFSYQTFFPTMREADEFKKSNAKPSGNEKISESTKMKVSTLNIYFLDKSSSIREIDFDDVNNWLINNERIAHFDMPHYRRLAIGWSIVNGTYPQINLDSELLDLFMNEYVSRKCIRDNPMHEAVRRILSEYSNGISKDRLLDFMDNYYQTPKAHTTSIINSLRRYGVITLTNGKYVVTSDAIKQHDSEKKKIEKIFIQL